MLTLSVGSAIETMMGFNKRICGGVIAIVVAMSLAGTGCYGNETTAFPAGLEPWEDPNLAVQMADGGTNGYMEQLQFVRTWYMHPVSNARIHSVHARAYIMQPIATVWAAARDPQTGRDPVSSHGFSIQEYNTEPNYQYSYRTHVLVNSIQTLEWDVNWRHGVVAGTASAPTLTATRWQKTSGTTAITVIEGSLVLATVPGQPNITEVRYQYHLQAAFSGHDTIINYLTVIFGRLKDRAHGVPLNPNDCNNCPTPPEGY